MRSAGLPGLRLRLGVVFTLLFFLTIVHAPAFADVIILKDGTTLHGNIGKETTGITDTVTGETFPVAKVNALKFIDDGPRWTIFSDHRARIGDVQDKVNKFADMEVFRGTLVSAQRRKLPTAISFVRQTEFDAKWVRVLYYRELTQPGALPYEIKQKVIVLTPHYIRLDSPNYQWTSYYSTQELGQDRVRALLKDHPDLQEKDGEPDPVKRSRKIRFFIQAEWFDEAERDLTELIKLLPAEKERVEKFRKEIRDLQVEKTILGLEKAREAGRHTYVQETLKTLPKDLSGKLSLKVAAIDADYKTLFKQFHAAKRLMNDLLEKEIKKPELIEATKAVLLEVHPDTVSRLESFIVLATQAEEASLQGKAIIHSPEELLAVAITGWMLGKNSAETKVENALRVWEAREMVLIYQRTTSPVARDRLLQGFLKNSIPFGVDELAQLISLLPPADADQTTPTKPEKKSTGPIPNLPEGVDYLLQLPPEYQPGRSYPLLIVLPNGNEKLEDALSRMKDWPAQGGFITAVLRWNGGFSSDYGYTEQERLTATGLIWHLRRKYQVNSDKVYLFGFGEGATMALDVGSAHPDLFAGVVPMGAKLNATILREYWRNFQMTPLYLISGDFAGDSIVSMRFCLDHWMPRGYPVLTILYKGRGNEWFGAELPFIFDWLPRQTRARAIPTIGQSFGSGSEGEEYRSIRPGDNSFFWMSADSIAQSCLLENNKGRTFYGASIYAKIGEGNNFTVRTRGVDHASIWFVKGMIDFEKPVKVQWNGADVRVNNNKPIKPNYAVLLEDLYQRGDRQRPFFEKVELEMSKKK